MYHELREKYKLSIDAVSNIIKRESEYMSAFYSIFAYPPPL